jgi:HlyD family secretion protein
VRTATEGQRARRLKWTSVALVAVAIIAALIIWRLRPEGVAVVRPQVEPVAESIAATGRVAGTQESLIAPEQPGRLGALRVKEGEQVSSGQVVALLEDDVPRARLEQARAAVATAEAQLLEVQRGALASEIEQARAEIQARVADAQARLMRAEERLRELLAGGTAAQRQEAQAQVREAEARVAQARREVEQARALAESDDTARAALEQAQATLRAAVTGVERARIALDEAERDQARYERLYQEGAVPRIQVEERRAAVRTAREALEHANAERELAEVDVTRQRRLLGVTREAELQQAQAGLQTAEEALEAARARLRAIREPARAEEVAQQRAEVQAAREALAQTRAAGRAQLETLTSRPRPEEVAVAARRLQEAIRARDAAQAVLDAVQVEAPFAGVVTEVLNEPGSAVGPGQPILRLTQIQNPEVRVDVDERHLPLIRVGQQVVLTADAYPDRSFAGRVLRVGARADPQRGTVEVVVQPLSSPGWLRSGLTVDANIIVANRQRRLVVPTTAILRRGDRTLVLVVEDGIVKERRVALGQAGGEKAVILGGLRESEYVVIQSTSVQAGQRARPLIRGE